MKSLRTENEIIANWKDDIYKTVVSICCISYNHEPFIEDSIKGFLSQKTDFPFEILIHDDASTDNSQQIIKKYTASYPKLIKPILQAVNQRSKGVRPFSTTMKYAKSEYLALCEGDDCWINENKLQKQYDLMNQNKDINVCFHPAEQINYYRDLARSIIGRYKPENNLVAVEDVILKTYGMIPTASLFIRSRKVNEYLTFRENYPELTVGDIYIQIIFSLDRGALFIDDVMSIYRFGTQGSWSNNFMNSGQYRLQHANSMHFGLGKLNELSGRKFNKAFKISNIHRYYMAYIHYYNDNLVLPKELNSLHQSIESFIKHIDNYKNIIVYGCGSVADLILKNNMLKSKILYFIDNYSADKSIDDIEIKKTEELEEVQTPIIITVVGRCKRIEEDLKKLNPLLHTISIDDYLIKNLPDFFEHY